MPADYKATPIVVDGIMYVSTSFGRIVALEAASGEQLCHSIPGRGKEGDRLIWATTREVSHTGHEVKRSACSLPLTMPTSGQWMQRLEHPMKILAMPDE